MRLSRAEEPAGGRCISALSTQFVLKRAVENGMGIKTKFTINRELKFQGTRFALWGLPVFWDENDMPALLGYLIALAVFLGSGYAGLEWLASPDDPSTHQHPSYKPTSTNGGPKRSAANIAGTREAVPSAKDENTAPRTAAPAPAEDKVGREEAKAADSGGEISKKPDAVPTGGCMPIGLTASGEMVFPLQCRELIERQRGPVAVASTPPVQVDSAPTQIQAEVSGKPEESSDAVADANLKPEPSKSDAPVVEPKRIEENKQAKPTSDPKGEAESRRKSNELDGGDRAVSSHGPNDVSATNTVKPPNAQKFEADIKPKKAEKQKLGSDRRKLVLMRLETIEFPDGHREQRLLPMRQSRRAALPEWYNPLGLRWDAAHRLPERNSPFVILVHVETNPEAGSLRQTHWLSGLPERSLLPAVDPVGAMLREKDINAWVGTLIKPLAWPMKPPGSAANVDPAVSFWSWNYPDRTALLTQPSSAAAGLRECAKSFW
jgi:hypothetical protein